jgi:hypothetical protein
MDATGGCVFYSGGMAVGCKVGNDGLPVELLEFDVD